MNAASPSFLKTVGIFVRFRSRRVFNSFRTNHFFQKKKKTSLRSGTAFQFVPSLVIGAIFFAWISFSIYNFQHQQILTMRNDTLFTKVLPAQAKFVPPMAIFPKAGFVWKRQKSAPFYSAPAPHLKLLSTFIFLNLLGGLFFSLGSKQLAQSEWDLEFLITLPISKPLLMFSRIVERAVVNPVFYFLLFPTFFILFQFHNDPFFLCIIYGLIFSLPLFWISGAWQALIDTGFRISLKPARIKMLQGIFALLGILFFYFLNMTRGAGIQYLYRLSDWVSDWILFTPGGLLILSHYSRTFPYQELFMLTGEVLILVAIAYGCLLYLVRNGVVAGSGQGSFRKGSKPAVYDPKTGFASSWISPLMLREFRLLKRDPSYFFQTLLIPLLVFAVQIYVVSVSGSVKIFTSARLILSVGFGVASYAMMFSCFMCLQTEGGALWILYTWPKSISEFIWEKSLKWVTLSTLFLIGFVYFAMHAAHLPLTWEEVPSVIAAGVGVPLFGLLATSFGVLGFDGINTNTRKIKVHVTYAYLLFAGFYVALFMLPSPWQVLVGIVMMILVTQAFWQKSKDRLPYLLDPGSLPPPEVSLSDGIIAAQLFFVFQVILTFALSKIDEKPSPLLVVQALFIAGGTVWVLMIAYFKKVRARNVPRMMPIQKIRALFWGLSAGVCALILAAFYLLIVQHLNLFSETLKAPDLAGENWKLWMGFYAVIGAPLFEEFIFRGLIYRGLRRSLHPALALILSSLIFAMVHPPAAFVPVFILGLFSAFVFEKTQSLMGSMVTHAIYNTGVLLILPRLW